MRLRLNKAIASCGHCSRRAADKLIADGKVQVNGKRVTDFSLSVNLDKDKVAIAGKTLNVCPKQYVLLHKPEGIVSTCKDEHGRRQITDLLPDNLKHLKPAGRLDYDSSGLMLLTNDGELIQALTHPKNKTEKTYQLVVSGQCMPAVLRQMALGVTLNEGKTAKAKVKLLESNQSRSIIEITIIEGKNRQLRRMSALMGLPVLELVRTRIDKLQLSNLAPGKWRYITKSEIIALARHLDLETNRT